MRICRIFIALCLACSFLIPDQVYADEGTYVVVEHCFSYDLSNGQYRYYGVFDYTGNVEIRALVIQNAGQTRIYFVSDTNFYFSTNDGGSSCPTLVNYQPLLTNGYYVAYGTTANYGTALFSGNVPVIQLQTAINNSDARVLAVNYTWGSNAVAPSEPLPNYGDLVDVRFNTSIAGSGSASINNIDHITWNPDHDSNEIMFDGSESVQIRAIAGNYTSSTRNGLLTGTVTDFDYNSSAEHMLAEYPVTRGYYDVTWSHVIEQLHAGSVSDFLQIRKDNETWLKSGWIYQIRLVAGEYNGQWITIYNGTSSGVQNALNIENSTEINTTLINTIQQINNLNNSIDEDWTINNITINMENSDGTTTTDKPWWAYLLEAIVSLCSGILSFLGGLIGDLIDAILGLFQPAEFTINNYNEFKLELKENSGIFGQSFDFITTLKNTFLGVEYEEPIIHWSGIYFGEVALIPEADYNLNDYVTMWGLSDFRQIAYLCTDGFIYLSLLVLIMRKLNEVLKK